MTSYSVVVFAKNEEANIPVVLSQLLRRFSPNDLVFVLDGRIEPSAQLLSQQKIRVIAGPGRGKGAAIQKAIREIESEFLIFMDADGSHNSDEIPALLDPIVQDQADLVVASRFLGGSEELGGSLSNSLRWFGNSFGNWIINEIWNRNPRKITDAQNGFRALRRSTFLKLPILENSFSVEQEMVINCLKGKQRILEVASHERKRLHGRSHISYGHLYFYIKCFIRTFFARLKST